MQQTLLVEHIQAAFNMSDEWHNEVADTVYGLKLLRSHFIQQLSKEELDTLTAAIEMLEKKVFRI